MFHRSFTSLAHRPDLARQRGAVAIIVGLSIAVLVGFVGLALDLGKLYVAKTELQNSADACALAAARELTGASVDQLAIAEAAGIATGKSNLVSFQREQVIYTIDESVTFSETLNNPGYQPKTFYGPTEVVKMKYARCTVRKSDIANWFMQVLNLMPGTKIDKTQTVAATAVASVAPSQTNCALPVAVCSNSVSGKKPGEWLTALREPGDGLTGDYQWASFSSGGAKEIKDVLTGPGTCNIPAVGAEVGDPGSKAGAYDAWNTRFGIYKGSYNAGNAVPDFTGYAYTAKSWSSCKDVFIGGDFAQKRGNYVPIQNPTRDTTGLRVVPPANSSPVSVHQNGGDRRLGIVPVVDCDKLNTSHKASVQSWACVLMLHPLDQNADPEADACPGMVGKGTRMFLEYLGKVNEPLPNGSPNPCATVGIPGDPSGSVGPLVPVLVQ